MRQSLTGKTLFITGASRGIGLAIAVAAARDGANVAIAAKTAAPHKHLPGTIHSAAEAVEAAGGRALALQMDVRDEAQVTDAVRRTVDAFGGIDICVNNASAIDQATTLETEMKRFDLLHDVIARGTFLVSKTCLPHLLAAENPHILMLTSPPVMDPKKLARSLHNTMAKYAAAMCVIGMAEEFRDRGVAVNALQPRTWIGTSAIRFRRGEEAMRHCRTPEIMGEAACAIFRRPSRDYTGRFAIDDEVLWDEGERDFEKYRIDPAETLYLSGSLLDEPVPDYVHGAVAPPGTMGQNARALVIEPAAA